MDGYNDIDLGRLFIQIPSYSDNGDIKGHHDRSIKEIIEKNDYYEIIFLREWICENILNYIGWDSLGPISAETIGKAFAVFMQLGLKPIKFIYLRKEEKNEDNQ